MSLPYKIINAGAKTKGYYKHKKGFYTEYYCRKQKKQIRVKLAPTKGLSIPALEKLQYQLTTTVNQVSNPDITLNQYYHEHYKDDYLPNNKKWNRDQIGYIERYILPTFGNTLLEDLNQYNIEKWYRRLENQRHRKTANCIAMVFKTMLRRAEGIFITNSPILNLKLKPKIKKIPDTLTPQEVKEAYHNLKGHERFIFLLWVHTGLRTGEMQHMQYKDIDIKAGKVYIRSKIGGIYAQKGIEHQIKDNEDRYVTIKKDIIMSLSASMSDPEKYIFNNLDRPYVNMTRYIRAMFGTIISRKITGTLLRHTFASIMLSNGCPLAELKNYMGHASIKTTEENYAAFIPPENSKIHDTDFGISLTPKLKIKKLGQV